MPPLRGSNRQDLFEFPRLARRGLYDIATPWLSTGDVPGQLAPMNRGLSVLGSRGKAAMAHL